MNITQRLLLTFTLLSAALIALGITAILLISGFQSRFEEVRVNAIPSIKHLSQLIDQSNKLSLTLYKHQSQTDNSKIASQVEEASAASRSLQEQADSLARLVAEFKVRQADLGAHAFARQAQPSLARLGQQTQQPVTDAPDWQSF